MAVQGVVKDALKGTAVSGATVKLRKGWNSRSGAYVKTLFGEERKATTASDGSFSIEANMGIYTAEITKNGFITGYYNVVSVDTGSFSNYSKTSMVLTPRLSDDEYRIILMWGQTPTDLDSHLTYYVDNVQKFHVSYMSKVANYKGVTVAKLDLDDTSSYGPETVTITLDANLVKEGGTFQYSVHNFSNKSNSTSKQLSLSGAAVQIYAGNNRVKTFCVPKDQIGTVWHVFDITKDGVVAINDFYNSTDAGRVR